MVVSIAMYILITPLLEQVSQFLPVHYAVYTQAYLDDSMNDIKLQNRWDSSCYFLYYHPLGYNEKA